MEQNESSRRSFLRKALTLSAVTALPTILTNTVSGVEQPATKSVSAGEKVNLALCGIGNRGGEIAQALYDTGLCNIVALCDVDMGAPHTLKVMNMFPNVAKFQDFRVMFDKMGSQIDAVTAGVPDFAHFPIAMLAMSLGKGIYSEKPMGRTFNEVQLMMNAAKKYKVANQMGNQGHSEANYFQFKAWKEAGIIKDVTAVTAHMNSARRWHGWDFKNAKYPDAQPIPATLDWEQWHMTTAKKHDYNKDYHLGQWRCWYDFGMGALGDWGAHIIDTCHEFLDLGLPYEVEALKAEGWNSYYYPQSTTLVFKFPKRGNMPAMDITWYDGVNNVPQVPEGYGVSALDPNIPPTSTGKIQPSKLNPGKIIYSKELIFKGGSHGSTLSIIPEAKAKEMASKLPEVPKSPSNHFANFLLAVKGQEICRSRFEISGPLSQVFNLGVLAQQLNTKLVFDREKKQITNNKVANELLVNAAPRKGWEQYYKL